MKRLFLNLGLAGGSVLIGLLAVEIVLRAMALGSPKGLEDLAQPAPLIGDEPADRPAHERLSFADLIRISSNRDQVYELRPNVSGRFKGESVRINAAGYRGPLAGSPRPDDVDLRIVSLGDSVAFGWGVADAESYARRLETELRRRFPGLGVEVINLGVPGFNAFQEAAQFEALGRNLEPDAVLLMINGNDAGLPNFLGKPQDPFALDYSFLGNFVTTHLQRLRSDENELLAFGEPGELVRTRDIEIGGRRLEAGDEEAVAAQIDRIPAAYRRLVGYDAARRAYERLASSAQDVHAEVFIASYYPVSRFARAMRPSTESLGWQHVELSPSVDEELARTGDAFADLLLSRRDPHPNSRYHSLIAEALLDGLTPWITQRFEGTTPRKGDGVALEALSSGETLAAGEAEEAGEAGKTGGTDS